MYTAIEYAVALPDGRYLARLRTRNIAIHYTTFNNTFFTPPLQDIHKHILNDLNKFFSFSNIKEDNTILFKVLKKGASNLTKYVYILQLNSSVRFAERISHTIYENLYPISKELIVNLLKKETLITTYPKLLSVNEKDIMESVTGGIHYIH